MRPEIFVGCRRNARVLWPIELAIPVVVFAEKGCPMGRAQVCEVLVVLHPRGKSELAGDTTKLNGFVIRAVRLLEER